MKWIPISLVVFLTLMGCSSSQHPVIVHDKDTGGLLVSSVSVDDWVRIHLKNGSSCQGQVVAVEAETISLQYPEFDYGQRSTKRERFAWTDIERMEMRDPNRWVGGKFLIGLAAGVSLGIILVLEHYGWF